MARLPDNITVTVGEVSQTIDLSEFSEVDFVGQNNLKTRITQEIIDRIVDRSKGGQDIRGNSFKPYKKSYKDSDTFEAFEKGNNVNMTLTGDMLSSINSVSDQGNEIKIGWNDQENNAKAFNHMTGDTVRKREFFGIQKNIIKEVLKDFKEEISNLKESQSGEPVVGSLSIGGFLGEG